MNILIVGSLYPPIAFGGYEALCERVVDGFRERGHRVRVLTTAFRSEDCEPQQDVHRELLLTTDFPRPGEVVSHVDFSLSGMQRVSRHNQAIVRRHIDEERPDVIFAWCHSRLGLGTFFAAQEAGVPVAYTVNDVHPQQFRPTRGWKPRQLVKAALERWVWPLATLRNLRPFPITIISEFLKRTLTAGGTPIEHAEVIYQAVEMNGLPFAPMARTSDGPLRVCYVGQVEVKKGVHTLIEAVAACRGDVDIQLDIVGTGVPDYADRLVALAEVRGITDRVSFLGHVPHDEIGSVLREHHVLVFPSVCPEGFGLSHVEAMASGCAVISTLEGGSAELIRDRVNALAYDAGDASALADCLNALATDEDLRMGLARRARLWVEERHSFPHYLDQLQDFLERAIGDGGRAARDVVRSSDGSKPRMTERDPVLS